jgi:hypothetical protein
MKERHHKNKNKIDNRALFFVLSFNLLLYYYGSTRQCYLIGKIHRHRRRWPVYIRNSSSL